MSRLPTNESVLVCENKARSLEKLVERYYGKRDLLATWDMLIECVDREYRMDLKRRVQSHKNDLMYRGAL